jgi:hypothetical protein
MKINTVDLNALKFNQISIIVLTLIGFILNARFLPAFVAAVMVLGSIFPQAALFKLIYRRAAVPLHILKPEISKESPAPHNFAQLFGGIVLAAGTFLLYLGSAASGWVLTWIVIVLAAVNVGFGFCAGCFVYFQLARLNIPGFRSSQSGRPGISS